jgi:hypothetical protein
MLNNICSLQPAGGEGRSDDFPTPKAEGRAVHLDDARTTGTTPSALEPRPIQVSHEQTGDGPFHSILFQGANKEGRLDLHEAPPYFHDLNLDQVVAAITTGWQEYDLAPFFYASLTDADAVVYRQEVMQDLEDKNLMDAVQVFAQRLHKMREHLTQSKKLYYKFEKARWFLGAVDLYVKGIQDFLQCLCQINPASRGLRSFHAYLEAYAKSASFQQLAVDAGNLTAELAAIRYCLQIKDNSITVRPYLGEIDYSASVEATFEKFRLGATKDYRVAFHAWPGLNHVEAQILDRVALLNPGTFQSLDGFTEEHQDFLDDTVMRYDREIHFYVAYLTYIEPFRKAGLSFCIPKVSGSTKAISAHGIFDLALAHKLLQDQATVVRNDFHMGGLERIFVVSGPNQGGKTTFARAFGQIHHLASLGCPVAGSQAQLFLPDRIFTHFEREEDIANLRGKLHDDLVRIREILDQATTNSLVIMNEIFSSTTLKDAVYLSREILAKISRLDLLGLCVTFLTELASLNEKTVSLVSGVAPEDPAIRTYRLERRPPDGLSYALALAEKHRLTHRQLLRRIKP